MDLFSPVFINNGIPPLLRAKNESSSNIMRCTCQDSGRQNPTTSDIESKQTVKAPRSIHLFFPSNRDTMRANKLTPTIAKVKTSTLDTYNNKAIAGSPNRIPASIPHAKAQEYPTIR